MSLRQYSSEDIKLNVVKEDDGDDFWNAQEERRLRESILSSYTDRFKIMMRLMRIEHMLSRAKIIHKKPEWHDMDIMDTNLR